MVAGLVSGVSDIIVAFCVFWRFNLSVNSRLTRSCQVFLGVFLGVVLLPIKAVNHLLRNIGLLRGHHNGVGFQH